MPSSDEQVLSWPVLSKSIKHFKFLERAILLLLSFFDVNSLFYYSTIPGWINVGDLQGAVHFKIVKYERIKFLVIALRESIEIYAW